MAYRVFDPLVVAPGSPGSSSGQAQNPDAATTREVGLVDGVAPFHSTSHEKIPVYHDRSDCPYGREIIREGDDERGTGGHRRCDWCDHALSPAA
jgi:hypothetical protein